ncbi:MAG: hypothetical protein HY900_08785 [Deltaproteobacteria bacterium]|nr:hypothetical protein [Deltaproteobacteria bacterium]
MTECGRALRTMGRGAGSMEEAANRIVSHLHASLIDGRTGTRACSLVRFFKTHPLERLDEDLQGFARAMCTDSRVFPEMKCLVLLASAGELSEWSSRRSSTGHKAIPLPSEEAVHQIPMIRNLIKQLGMSVSSVVKPDPEIILDPEQKTFNVFVIPEALGSPHIPAQQDFIIPHGIKSVLGFGGGFPSGELFAVIMFSKVPISEDLAALFRPLALNVMIAVLPLTATVFAEPGSSPPASTSK